MKSFCCKEIEIFERKNVFNFPLIYAHFAICNFVALNFNIYIYIYICIYIYMYIYIKYIYNIYICIYVCMYVYTEGTIDREIDR